MNIYFIGVGGVGIGPLAEIALDNDYLVCGSDPDPSVMYHQLESKGATLSIVQDGSFLRACHNQTPLDWVVHTSGASDDNPDIVAARDLGIKVTKRDAFLSHILRERSLKLIAVAGTHGKTTTTAMLVWTLQQLGMPVSYSVGSKMSFGPSGAYDARSEYFVYECDEYDRNFLMYQPYLSLITSIDYDHPDTYPSQDVYVEAFRTFAEQSEQVIGWRDQHGEILESHPDAWILDTPIEIQIPGAHNRRNATLVVKALEKLAVTEDPARVLESFPGTSRRFEKLAENLYSDYAHHPTEIAATLQLAHEVSDRIVVVYQPHQNIRQHELRGQYTTQFELADKIYWLPTYLSREDPSLPIVTPEELSSSLTNRDHVIITQPSEALWDHIQRARDDGALVIIMGAGQIDAWVREQIAAQ